MHTAKHKALRAVASAPLRAARFSLLLRRRWHFMGISSDVFRAGLWVFAIPVFVPVVLVRARVPCLCVPCMPANACALWMMGTHTQHPIGHRARGVVAPAFLASSRTLCKRIACPAGQKLAYLNNHL